MHENMHKNMNENMYIESIGETEAAEGGDDEPGKLRHH